MVPGSASSSSLSILEGWLAGLLEESTDGPLVLGLCGAQGSGKSILARSLADRFASRGRRVAVLSLDDLYLTKAERSRLAQEVHPLLGTRGVPGTHDVALGLQILNT